VAIGGPALRLTIFVTRTDQWHWHPVATEIVHRAHKAGLAGATIIHGVAGYAAGGKMHTPHLFSLAQELPAMIVIVDAELRIRGFLPQLDELLTGSGLVVLDRVETIAYPR
jgi:PII-like signaling protein